MNSLQERIENELGNGYVKDKIHSILQKRIDVGADYYGGGYIEPNVIPNQERIRQIYEDKIAMGAGDINNLNDYIGMNNLYGLENPYVGGVGTKAGARKALQTKCDRGEIHFIGGKPCRPRKSSSLKRVTRKSSGSKRVIPRSSILKGLKTKCKRGEIKYINKKPCKSYKGGMVLPPYSMYTPELLGYGIESMEQRHQSAKRGASKNPWIAFVKDFSARYDVPYNEVLINPEYKQLAEQEYHSMYPYGAGGVVVGGVPVGGVVIGGSRKRKASRY